MTETTTRPAVDYVARARAIAPIITAEADAMEAGATITRPVVDAIAEQGLFWLLVPSEYGGGGQDIVTSLKVVEELARADGSVGWAFMANAFSTGIAVGYFPEEGARDIFAGENKGITAGMILPTGKGVRVEGGYRVTGTYGFGSGSHHASWIGAGFVVEGEEGPGGTPVCRVAFVPRENVEFLGGWNVMGMVATGSDNYAVRDLFVPESHTMDTFSMVPVRPEPVYKLGLLGIGVGGHAPVALGIAQRALEEIALIASTKSRPGYPTVVGDSHMFRREFVAKEALLQAARRYVYDAHADAEAAAASGEISDEQRARLRQVTTWVQEVAREIVTFAYSWGGSASIRNPSVLGRCLRDISVGAQHLLVEPMTLVEAADPILAGYLPTAAPQTEPLMTNADLLKAAFTDPALLVDLYADDMTWAGFTLDGTQRLYTKGEFLEAFGILAKLDAAANEVVRTDETDDGLVTAWVRIYRKLGDEVLDTTMVMTHQFVDGKVTRGADICPPSFARFWAATGLSL